MTNVRQVLERKPNKQVWAIDPHDSVFEAIRLMGQRNVGALVVMRDSEIVGIVTERDYSRKVALEYRSSHSARVWQIMTEQVMFVEANDSIDGCMALMTEKRIRHLPVLENDALIGLISMGDVVKAVITDQEFLIEQLTRYVTDSYTDSSYSHPSVYEAEVEERLL